MKKQKAAVLFTGGKDSCLALHKAKQNGFDIKYLLSVIPKNFDSFMFHKPDFNLLEKQAEMLDIDLLIMESEGKKEKEIEDLRELIEKVREEVEVIVVGGIASSYQGKRIKKICSELNLKFFAPLWNFDGEEIWKILLEKGFNVILTKISCEGLPRNFLGKIISEREFKELKKLSEEYKFDLTGEGGDFETAVLEMPGFKKNIKIKFDIKDEGKYRHFLEIIEVNFYNKN